MKAFSSSIIVLAGTIGVSAATIASGIRGRSTDLIPGLAVGSTILVAIGVIAWLTDRKSES